MPFVKLDCGILDSTLWPDIVLRNVFITALLMAKPVQLTQEAEQLHVRSLEKTGWIVPPGWYGVVEAAGVGIVRRSEVEIETGLSALERLGQPELDSRTPDFEGRRLVRVGGGYIVLNFNRYREKDHTAAQRSKRWRDNKKQHGDTPLRNVATRSATQAEAEAEADPLSKERGTKNLSLPQEAVRWNLVCGSISTVATVGKSRMKHLVARRSELFWALNLEQGLEKIKVSTFCQGVNDRGWKATFDWLIQPDSLAKVIEGKYDNRKPAGRPAQENSRNAGTYGTSTNYPEVLAKRKRAEVAGQVAPNQNPGQAVTPQLGV